MIDWRDLSPSEVLERFEVLNMEMTAYVLTLNHTRGSVKGRPNPRLVRDLVAAGKLRLMDPDQEREHWKIPASEVRRYRDAGTPRGGQRTIGAA